MCCHCQHSGGSASCSCTRWTPVLNDDAQAWPTVLLLAPDCCWRRLRFKSCVGFGQCWLVMFGRCQRLLAQRKVLLLSTPHICCLCVLAPSLGVVAGQAVCCSFEACASYVEVFSWQLWLRGLLCGGCKTKPHMQHLFDVKFSETHTRCSCAQELPELPEHSLSVAGGSWPHACASCTVLHSTCTAATAAALSTC